MSKDMKSVDEMVDYVHQLRLHAKGRRAIHIRLSRLEKHFRDEHYRRFVAVTLRPLLTNFNAVMFALPTNDVVLMTEDVNVDHIDPLLHHIRRKFRESALIVGLDPVQGVSDAFVEWFDIEQDYPAFRKYMEYLADSIRTGTDSNHVGTAEANFRKPVPVDRSIPVATKAKSRAATQPLKRMGRLVPVELPSKEVIAPRQMDPELVVALDKALATADVINMLRRQHVMAIIGGHPPEPVMEHRFVPVSVVLGKLLMAQVYGEDRWLRGYLAELLARRLLLSVPNMKNGHSIASSLRISCATVGEAGFDQFDRSVGSQKRSKIILEFSAADVVTNFGDYRRAHAKIDPLGYKVMIGDIDLRALLWLKYQSFDADFVKLKLPDDDIENWLDAALEKELRNQIHQIGIARVILDGCSSEKDIETGQRLGITLFQGEAVSAMTS